MTAVFVSAPPHKSPVIDASGRLSGPWKAFFEGLYRRAGGVADKVDAAHAAAVAAVPKSTQVVAAGGLQVGGPLSRNVGISLYRVTCAVAALPAAGAEGDWAYAFDGRKPGEGAAAGTGVPCFWSNAHWIAVTSGAIVTA